MGQEIKLYGTNLIVYFAGAETTCTSYNIRPKRQDHIFCSYFYKKNTQKYLDSNGKHLGHEGIITIDSGAHSFFGAAGISSAGHQQNTKAKLPDHEIYFRDYVAWLKKNYDKFSYFVELDIQAIIGLKRVKEWRQILKQEGLYSKCIPVMHSIDTWDDFIEMCETCDSKYIGFEGMRKKKITMPYMKMLKYCHKNGVRVHGFALTAKEVTTKYPFYSVDSTTWTVPNRFGTVIVLEDGQMKQKAPKKENIMKYGKPLSSWNKDKSKEGCKDKLLDAMIVQRRYQRFLTDYWKVKGIVWQKDG